MKGIESDDKKICTVYISYGNIAVSKTLESSIPDYRFHKDSLSNIDGDQVCDLIKSFGIKAEKKSVYEILDELRSNCRAAGNIAYRLTVNVSNCTTSQLEFH